MEIIVQCIVFLITFFKLFLIDRFCALFYIILYIYLLPVEIICGYFPILLEPHLTVDDNIYKEFYCFSTISILFFWCVIYGFMKKKRNTYFHCIDIKAVKGKDTIRKMKWAYFFIVSLGIIQIFCIFKSFNDISYVNVVDTAFMQSHPYLMMANTLFAYTKAFIILLFFKVRQSEGREKRWLTIFLISILLLDVFYGSLSGSRSGIIAIFIGLGMAIYGETHFTLKKILKLGVFLTLLYFLLDFVLSYRLGEANNTQDLDYAILQQDYAGPATNTIAVIKYKYIDPVEVVLSNVLKTPILIDYPYLYITIGKLYIPELVTASEGMGFFPLTEGFAFAGHFGFLYNGFIIGGLLIYWRRFGRTNSRSFNLFVLAVMSTFFFGMVRSQSTSFIRNIYLQILPMIVLYSWLMGIKIKYKVLFFNAK